MESELISVPAAGGASTNTTPRLSVALCTCDGEQWIDELLDSIATQSCPPSELVALDDCSTDGTVARLEAFAARAPFPVHISRNERRLGSTASFELALARCSGQFIALADQDDVWYSHKLQRMLDVLGSDPTLTLAFSNADLIDEGGRPLGRLLWDTRLIGRQLRRNAVVSEDLIARQGLTTGCTMVIRRRAAEAALPFPVELQDIDAPMRHDRWLSLVGAAVGTVSALPEPLLAFRVHPAQQTGVLIGRQLSVALARAAVAAITGIADDHTSAHLVRARQLDAAASRADLVGDFQEADVIRRIAEHHRRRADHAGSRTERLANVWTGLKEGSFDSSLFGAGAVLADLARSMHRPRRHPEESE